MELKKFTKNKKQKRIVIGSIVGILLLIGEITLYRTFALYKVEKSFDVLNGTVPDFSSGDVTLAFTVNGNKESGVPFPNKNEGFKVESVKCENNENAGWDDETWSLTNIQNPDSQNKIKCTINFKRYEEKLLNGSYPVLKEGLVPVTIDGSGKVTKADVTQNWYSYQNKQWANAVILVDGVKEPEAGKEIPENQIESYFVWIPKYKYKIQTMGVSSFSNEKSFEIQFGTENTTDTDENCKTPMESGADGTCEVDKWMTHPAFISFDVNGLWIGKFETGYNQNTNTNDVTLNSNWTTEGAQHNENNASKVIIKPNVYSWRAMTLNNMFTTAKGYKENLDSHMMKNTEWGAVAYLTQSIYGRCKTENGSTSCTEVGINGTGYTTGYYNTNDTYPNSSNASTTENNTGIFDMRGGASDMVIGFRKSSLNEMFQFIKNEASAYYDIYNDDTSVTGYRILGDATSETYNWYRDYTYFGKLLFIRGGHGVNGDSSGIFSFYSHDDESSINDTFRIILTPQ